MIRWKESWRIAVPRAAVVLHDLLMVWLAWYGLHQFRYALQAPAGATTSPAVIEVVLVLVADTLRLPKFEIQQRLGRNRRPEEALGPAA